MATTIKRGQTLRAKIELDELEWAALWPWDSIAADARRNRTAVAHPMAVTPVVGERAIWIRADTSAWPIGQVQFDVRVTRGDSVVYLPPALVHVGRGHSPGGGGLGMKITFYVGSDISETTETNWPVAVPGCGTGNGDPGRSAYEIAVQNGFSGNGLDWLASLVGTPGQGINVLAFAKADQAGFDAALAAHAGNPLVFVIRRNV